MKRVFPPLLYACLGIAAILGALEGKASDPTYFLGIAVAAAAVYVFQRLLVRDTADEVVDLGEYLMVRRGGTRDRIDVANILKVDASVNLSPPLVTLHLVKPGKFGRLVSFIPAGGNMNPVGGHPLVAELMRRAHESRSGGSRRAYGGEDAV